MQEHHGPAKETDITNILVIAFVVLVAVMIAKVAGDFTSKSTSTSTKAESPTDAQARCATLFDKYFNVGSTYSNFNYEYASKLPSCGTRDSSKNGTSNKVYIGYSFLPQGIYCCTNNLNIHFSRGDSYCSLLKFNIFDKDGKKYKSNIIFGAKAKTTCDSKGESNDTANEYSKELSKEFKVGDFTVKYEKNTDIYVKVPNAFSSHSEIKPNYDYIHYRGENDKGKCCVKPGDAAAAVKK